MNVAFLGGQNAGVVGLLAAASKHRVIACVPYSPQVIEVAAALGIMSTTLGHLAELVTPSTCDVILSVHCRQIVPDAMLERAKKGGINVHPCLWRYKGADPIGRWLKDRPQRASVGAHRMTSVVDEGEVLAERFVRIDDAARTRDDVYQRLYAAYAVVTLEALARA